MEPIPIDQDDNADHITRGAAPAPQLRQPHPDYLTRADISRNPRAPNNKSALTSDMTHGDGLLFLAYLLTKLSDVCKCGAFQTSTIPLDAAALPPLPPSAAPTMPAVSIHLEEEDADEDEDDELDSDQDQWSWEEDLDLDMA